MNRRIASTLALLVGATTLGLGQTQSRACVDFEAPLKMATPLGGGAQSSTRPAFTQNGIAVYVQSSGTPTAQIADTAPIAQGQYVKTQGELFLFDFTGLKFAPKRVTVDLQDGTTRSTLQVNGSPAWVGNLTKISKVKLGGATATATGSASRTHRLTVTGTVFTIAMSGVELWMDNVCAYR
jgi:hypothetical protein